MEFQCKKCNKIKEASSFSKHPGCKSGYDTSACKQCKKAVWDWEKVPLNKRIYNRIKSRAKKKNQHFDLKLEDIIIPTICPVFNKPFIYGDVDWTYSVDRIDNSKGYEKENIIIVSLKANRVKNDCSIEDLQKVIDFYKSF